MRIGKENNPGLIRKLILNTYLRLSLGAHYKSATTWDVGEERFRKRLTRGSNGILEKEGELH